MNEAFDAVAIGDYVNGQEKFITKTKTKTLPFKPWLLAECP